ncbi:DoxX family protein [Novosphingobium sp.]|uniref:DoxX family protein n=1 Tax=Novosphingobium sp. TaxID=1874826 RepID=UPI003BAA163B
MSPQSNALASPVALLDRIPTDLVQLALRGGLAGIFWSSARTKVEGLLTISDNTYFLFEEEYRLPLIAPDLAAHLATYAEHLLPAMLLLGIGSRFAALGLFIMTLTIQLFVYPDAFLSTHLGWFALALAIMGRGPGRISLDYLLARKTESRTSPTA